MVGQDQFQISITAPQCVSGQDPTHATSSGSDQLYVQVEIS